MTEKTYSRQNQNRITASGVTAAALLALAIFASTGLTLAATTTTAYAEMVAEPITTFALKDAGSKTIQLNGSANYPTFHYEIYVQPNKGGTVTITDEKAGTAVYTPNPGAPTGTIEQFQYKIVSDYNDAWTSRPAVVKVAIAEPWREFVDSPYSPVDLAAYFIDNNLNTPERFPENIGVTNIEPQKATPMGHMTYTNGKLAVELSGQSWWDLTLGQKDWIMDQYANMLNKMQWQGFTVAP